VLHFARRHRDATSTASTGRRLVGENPERENPREPGRTRENPGEPERTRENTREPGRTPAHRGPDGGFQRGTFSFQHLGPRTRLVIRVCVCVSVCVCGGGPAPTHTHTHTDTHRVPDMFYKAVLGGEPGGVCIAAISTER